MKPQGHVVVSAGLGTLFWARSRDPWTLALSLAFGVLVDLDHFIDYWYADGLGFDLKTFMATRYWNRSGRLFILFHAWEYLPLVFLLWHAWKGRRWAVAATAAMSSHIIADHLVNELKPLGYFVLYRLKHGFQADHILDWRRVRRMDEQRERRRQMRREGREPWYLRLAAFFV